MHRGAFFWVKVDMKKVYRSEGGLAMVPESRVAGDRVAGDLRLDAVGDGLASGAWRPG